MKHQPSFGSSSAAEPAPLQGGSSSTPLAGTARAKTDHILRSLSQNLGTGNRNKSPGGQDMSLTNPFATPSSQDSLTAAASHAASHDSRTDSGRPFRSFRDLRFTEPPPPSPLSVPSSASSSMPATSSAAAEEPGPRKNQTSWSWKAHMAEVSELDGVGEEDPAAFASRSSPPPAPHLKATDRSRPRDFAKNDQRHRARDPEAAGARQHGGEPRGPGEAGTGSEQGGSTWYSQFLPSWYDG